MAANGGARMDQQAHENTYRGFLTMLKVGAGIAIVSAAVVIILIAS